MPSLRLEILLACALGGLLTFGGVRLLERFPLGSPDETDLTLVIPAVSASTYRFAARRGFTALLRSENGRRLELPLQWLPGDAQLGDRFTVRTNISSADERSTFEIGITPVQ